MSLVEFLDKYGVETTQQHKHATTGWIQIRECPDCQSQNFHLGIKLDGSRASCFRCGGKNVSNLLKTLSQAPWPEIKAVVQAGIFVPREAELQHTGAYTPPTSMLPLSQCKKHSKYMKSRGFDIDYCEQVWGLQGTGVWSNYPWRVFIPVTYRNRPVSWTARAIVDGVDPKYQTASPEEKSLDEKDFLFGMDKAKGNAVIVVEGPLGAIKIGEGATATYGLAYTQKQFLCLLKYNRRIVCFDNEPQAQRRAKELAASLSAFPGETFNVNLDAEDPGTISPKERESLRKFAFGRV